MKKSEKREILRKNLGFQKNFERFGWVLRDSDLLQREVMWKLVRSEEVKWPKMSFGFKKLTAILRGDQGNREGSFVNLWRRTRWVGGNRGERGRSRSSRKNKVRIGRVRTLRIYYDNCSLMWHYFFLSFFVFFSSLSDGENWKNVFSIHNY